MFDVIVVGAGNAGLVAAISAKARARRVLLLERSPEWMRGGNSRHTRDIRYAHGDDDPYTEGAYPEEELLEDLLRVGGERVNRDLARLCVRESKNVLPWMSAQGVKWQQPLKGTLHLSRTCRFFLGGGKAAVNAYFKTAQRMGVEVRYDTTVEDLAIDGRSVTGVAVERLGERQTLLARSVILASGGFEANVEWLREHWGPAIDNFVIRGTPHNDGRPLAALLRAGAMPVGEPKAAHAVCVDARAPRFDGGIVTRLDATPFGIVLNKHCRRFYDEGEDIWPKRYAIWGGLIGEQPGQIAYAVIDSRMLDKFLPSLYRPFQGQTLPELGAALGLDPGAFAATVEEYNRHASRDGTFNPAILDDCTTRGLDPPKTHWAMPIEVPPFYGYPMRPGITFTYLGLAVDETTRVQMKVGEPFTNLYAAGEIMSGSILTRGYLGGFGLTIGTVFGRIAGKEAAKHAAN
ncbi:MAG: FAD-dependent tricarballylate dehydrogenase TcuA [Chloroflexi bacterium]|nr:FAD-dependent tricarballylate dehydrogenase TcuA [Chloroflexota bacterium]MCL5026008.1 FAD-dependent tricarballylate dehydrogenase TcuA [Chloroflexota bacterium]